jgi:hypothetical protein
VNVYNGYNLDNTLIIGEDRMFSYIKKVSVSLLLLADLQMLYATPIEPKIYVNIPTGLNVMVLGYGNSMGAIPGNEALELVDPELDINSVFLAYVRSFDIYGHHAKFDMNIPFSHMNGTAEVADAPASRKVQGLADTRARVTYTLFGAPALSPKEFASYKPDVVVGVSLQVTVPTGQYDSSKLINVSPHRWAIKPGIGISKTINKNTFEWTADAEFYTANREFLGSHTRKQETVYSTQIHGIHTFRPGMWAGIGATYYWGGEYINDGHGSDTELKNSRIGAAFAYPLNKQHAVQISASKGISTRFGSDFNMVMLTWQYHWMD